MVLVLQALSDVSVGSCWTRLTADRNIADVSSVPEGLFRRLQHVISRSFPDMFD